MELEPEELRRHLTHIARRAALGEVDTTPPRDRVIALPGTSIRILDWEGTGPSLLFLHGGALTAHTWDAVCLALRGRYRCVAMDLRGHGNSAWSAAGQYDFADYAGDVRGVVQALGFERPLLVGQSLGGLVALRVAGSGRPALSGAVIVDVGPSMSRGGTMRVLGFLGEQQELDSIDAFVSRALAFSPGRDPSLLRTSLRHNLRRTPTGRLAWKWDPAQFAEAHREKRMARRQTLAELLPHVQCPVLVARGSRSDMFLEDDARQMIDALPRGSGVVVEGAGHNVQTEQPARLAAALDEFARTIQF